VNVGVGGFFLSLALFCHGPFLSYFIATKLRGECFGCVSNPPQNFAMSNVVQVQLHRNKKIERTKGTADLFQQLVKLIF